MFRVYKTFYSFLFQYKWRFVIFTIALVVWGVINSINPYFYKLFIDAVPNRNYNELTTLLAVYIGVRILQIFTELTAFYLGDRVVIPAGRDARMTIFKKIQDLDFAFHSSKSTGSLISIMKRGDGAFFSAHDTINIDLAKIAINLIVVIVFLSTVKLEIGLIIFASFLVNIIVARFLIIMNMQKRKEFNAAEDEISDVIVDNMINYETVKLFAREEYEQKRLHDRFKRWSSALWGFANTFRMIEISVGTIGNVGLFLVIFNSLRYVVNTQLTPGEFILIIGFVTDFYPRFFQLVFRFRDIAKHHTDLQNYFGILDNSTLIKDPHHPVKQTTVKGEVEFKDITFTYPEAKKASLRNFNLQIRQGESIAFVGRSGAGKTTITKLLMRLFDPQKGEITIDGINIKNFAKTQLRSFLGLVPQEPILFNNTIGYNIGYGANKPTQAQIKAAAKMANIDEYIESLPDKYNTNVGERGIRLSGGQKQRLAIARMILSDPDIIIFDEATSHLDSESEKLIQDAFWKAAKGKTTIIIAHRLSTITRADKIVVLEQGKIKEIGSHRSLLTKDESLYKHLWDLQSHAAEEIEVI